MNRSGVQTECHADGNHCDSGYFREKMEGGGPFYRGNGVVTSKAIYEGGTQPPGEQRYLGWGGKLFVELTGAE